MSRDVDTLICDFVGILTSHGGGLTSHHRGSVCKFQIVFGDGAADDELLRVLIQVTCKLGELPTWIVSYQQENHLLDTCAGDIEEIEEKLLRQSPVTHSRLAGLADRITECKILPSATECHPEILQSYNVTTEKWVRVGGGGGVIRLKNKNRNRRASTKNRNLVNLFKGLQRVIYDSKKMGLHACVRLVSPHSYSVLDADSDSDSDPISADVLVIGRNKDDADALPAACRRGDVRGEVDIITIDHPHLPGRIAEYANKKNIITLLLYHILPDGALCSPGKDWEPAQDTLYITDTYTGYVHKWEPMHASGYVLREGRVSLSSLLFDTRKRTPCSHYTIAIDAEDRVRFQIRVDESHDITSIRVSVLDTHTVHIPHYCICHWYFTQDCARSCLDLQLGMQHAFDAEAAETEVNGGNITYITKRAMLLQNPGIPGSLTVTLKYTNNITEADCKRLLDYLLTTEVVSPFVAELQYDDTTLADEIASMVFPISHIAYAMKNPVSSNLVSFKIKIDLDPSTINHPQPPLPRSDPILRSIHGNGRIPQ